MEIYDSYTPVAMQVQLSTAGYVLRLMSSATGAPVLGPSDGVRASTTGAAVEVGLSSATESATITSVTTTGYRAAPDEVPWTEHDGVFTGIFAAPETDEEFIWDLSVTIAVTEPERASLVLDPKMIVRKTNP